MEQNRFSPPDAEFLHFADQFSKTWETLATEKNAILKSDGGRHEIELGKEFKDPSGKDINFDFRVSTSGKIQIRKDRLQASKYYTPDYIFYSIIWCWYRPHIQDIQEADDQAIKYYLALGRPPKDVALGIIETYQGNPNVNNTQRYKAAQNLLIKPKTTN